jgi:hypothetical protein
LRQYAVWLGGNAVLLTTAIALHGWAPGQLALLRDRRLPEFFALWTIMLFNYETARFTPERLVAESLALVREPNAQFLALQQRLARRAPRKSW